MAFQETVTLINRTQKKLYVRFDGIDSPIQPGENHGFPKEAVPYARMQNPLMGSEDPYNPGHYISLVGVKGRDDCSPLEQDETKPQRIDRTLLQDSGRTHEVLRGRKVQSAFEARVAGSDFELGGDNSR